jgi:hypothetical protein
LDQEIVVTLNAPSMNINTVLYEEINLFAVQLRSAQVLFQYSLYKQSSFFLHPGYITPLQLLLHNFQNASSNHGAECLKH